jgi:uncharacterized membrane protein
VPRRASLLRSLGLAALVCMLPLGAVAQAADTVTLTTPYPAVVADPGGSVRFSIAIDADRAGTVALEATGAPTGWTTSFRGGGSLVSAAYVDGSKPATVDLEVKVPSDATAGPAHLAVRATQRGGGSATLPLEVRVSDTSSGGVTLEAQYPTLKGPSGATYRFDLTLSNQTSQQQTFALQASGPTGWTVDARPTSSTQAATAVVDAGSTTQVQVSADAPADATAGSFAIAVEAVGGPEVARADLTVEIVGSYTLDVTTPDGRLNADVTAGSASPVTFEVRNTGSAPLAGVAMSATPPQGWKVTFDPALIEAIAPSDSATVTAEVTAADDAIAGDYVLTVAAKSDQASGQADIRTTVQTSPLWGFVGIAAIALVLVGLFLVFQRFGRR